MNANPFMAGFQCGIAAAVAVLNDRPFSEQCQIRLLERNDTVKAPATRVGFDRASCSLVIHQRRRMPRVEAAIKKDLGL